jgi:hypothetical protein
VALEDCGSGNEFVDRFPKNTKLYSIMTTRPEEKEAQNE